MSAVPVGQQFERPPMEANVRYRWLHARQREFYQSRKKRKIIRAGRRGGKTTMCGFIATAAFQNMRRVLYAVPTSDQITRFWSEITWALAELIEDGKVKSKQGVIWVPGEDYRIRCKTAWNADSLRGDYADLLILDEFQMMHESAWSEVGAPMLIDNHGDAIFVYTPPSVRSSGTSKADDVNHAKKMYKKAETDPRWLAMHFTSLDNPFLSKAGLEEVTQDMTSLAYRQEILAEDIDEVPGALWTRELIEKNRVSSYPPLKRVVVAVDPSGSSTTEAGIIAAGQGFNDHVYIIEDATVLAPTPRTWGQAAVTAYKKHSADRIIGERNYGGDMVRMVIETVDETAAYKDVVATRGKIVRAEPVAARYEKGKVHIVGHMPALEEEMVTYVPGNPSPNRYDAHAYAVLALVGQNLVFGDAWCDALLFDDETMPKDLPMLGAQDARYIGVKYGASKPTAFLDIIDDGTTLWIYRERFMDPNTEMRQRNDQELAAELKAFIGKVQNVEVIIPPHCASFEQELRDADIWHREASEKKEGDMQVRDTLRICGSLMFRKNLRVHKSCVHTASQFAAYSWSETRSASGIEVPEDENGETCIALRLVVGEKIPAWRLTQ